MFHKSSLSTETHVQVSYSLQKIRKILIYLFFLLTGCSSMQSNAHFHALRLIPGKDVKVEIDQFVKAHDIKAGSIVSAVGSLTEFALRYSDRPEVTKVKGHFEVVSLSGTVSSVSGSHLHMAVSDGDGKTIGGHMKEGNIVYTTLELVIAEYPAMVFKREMCPYSGYHELKVE